jgi:hypothetical protein
LGFALYDAETGGNQIGAALTRPNVSVANGIFTVQLDFGANAFTGANRFLEIAVKKPSETNYTTLTQRQMLTSSPYAIRTISATAADSLSSECVGCVTNAQINSIDGAKVSGVVANANTANSAVTAQSAATATTAATAGNVTGVVAIANGGTGSATQNFVDLSTNQTVAGNKIFTGTLSGAGVSNLIRVSTFNGLINTIAANATGYIFIGSTVNVTVTANQRVTGAATAVLGKTTADASYARIGLCYKPADFGVPLNFVNANYTEVQFSAQRQTYSASASVTGFAGGNYTVGYAGRRAGNVCGD